MHILWETTRKLKVNFHQVQINYFGNIWKFLFFLEISLNCNLWDGRSNNMKTLKEFHRKFTVRKWLENSQTTILIRTIKIDK